ncbi:MAG: sugar phosphate isomerase/epimerase [Desulfobulbaceae bacterium]|nr:sugar phosphate isomerase/epimerase [Desulfobulbaceae bacterium]HIJ77976.1 sugar phosphate isomerase/epimerase [Deltaproteobacteria bacterium]
MINQSQTATAPSFEHITANCFINVPFQRLRNNLKTLIKQGIQPEIGLEGDTLYTCSETDFAQVAKALKDNGLACTLHAPFFDLAPGALDPYILEASRNKLRRAFSLIELFAPKAIVCHLNYERDKHGNKQDAWFDKSLSTWQELLVIAGANNVSLMLENTYETTPDQLKRMLVALDSPFVRFCLDVGHVHAFAKNRWQDWLPELEPWLGQVHLHDNDGNRDSHLAPGQGSFDFAGLFSYLAMRKLSPIFTLEPHTEEGVGQSLQALANLELFSTR